MGQQRVLLTLAATALVLLASCYPDGEQEPFIRGDRPSLTMVFPKAVQSEEMSRVVDLATVEKGRGPGTQLRLGIRALVKVDVHGHQAYAVSFHESATLEQRTAIRAAIAAAGARVQIFENILPQNILLEQLDKKLDQP